MLGTTGFFIFIVLSLALVVVYAVAIICASAIVFSRIAFALAAALVASQGDIMLVASSGFLNYVAWFVVILGIVYALSTFPRVDMAIRFFCTILLSVFVLIIVIEVLGGLISLIAGTEFVFTTPYEILMKIVCTLFALVHMLFGLRPSYDAPANPLINVLERVLASFIYGISITFLCVSLQENWELSGFVAVLILVAGIVGSFFADIYLEGKDIFGLNDPNQVTMPK